MSGVSGSGALGTCTTILFVYMSLFLTRLTHDFHTLFSSLLEAMPSIGHTMVHMVLIRAAEALSHNALADNIFLIMVHAPSMLGLIHIHLFSPLHLERLGAGSPRSSLLTPALSTRALLTLCR